MSLLSMPRKGEDVMKLTMNITTCAEDTARYKNRKDLYDFFCGHGLNGLEVMEVGADEEGVLHPDDVLGVHLRYWSGWMDFWKSDESRLLEEYQTRENWEQIFGGSTPQALVEAYRQNIRFANTMKPEYLVFHVSECTMAESMLRRDYYYSDEEVCDAVIELLNQVVDEIDGEPWLLLENLWYAGLTMERPEIVKRLMDGIHYKKTGIMLDTGHLMHTNPKLKTPDEAVDYILTILGRYEDLSFIRGVHLHQSLTGSKAAEFMQNWKPMEGTYQQQMLDVMMHIFQIDIHRPFCSDRINEIFSHLSGLEFVCLEQITATREEHDRYLTEQMKYLA